MSEFSESYHLEWADQGAGVDVLRRAGLRGFVFPEANGWVTLVASGGEYGEPNRRLIEAAQGVLVQYLNAEDHGWMLVVYSGGIQMSRYECRWLDDDWSDDVKVLDAELDVDLLVRLASRHGADREVARSKLLRLLHPPSQEWLMEIFEQNDMQNPGHLVARLLGLTNFLWVGDRYGPEAEANDPGIVVVR